MEYMNDYAKKYFKEKFGREEINPEAPFIMQRYGCSDEEFHEFLKCFLKENQKKEVEISDETKTEKEKSDELVFPKMSAYQFLVENNKDRMDSVAINYYGEKITFREFVERIDIAAKGLREWGVKKGECVSMSMLETPEGLILFYALNKLGATAHMINISAGRRDIIEQIMSVKSTKYITLDLLYSKELSQILDEVEIKNVLLTSLTNAFDKKRNKDKARLKIITALKSISSKVKKDDKCISYAKVMSSGKKSKEPVDSVYEKDCLAAIAYTSGTSGTSKGVKASNDAFNAMPVQISSVEESLETGDIMFSTLPLWFYYSLVNSNHTPLCLGVSVSMDPLFNPKHLDKRLCEYKFQHWDTIPAYVEGMIKNDRVNSKNASCIKTLMTGGDYLLPELQRLAREKYGINVGQGYGYSETMGGFAYTYEKNPTIGSVGKILPGNQCKIIDIDTGLEVEEGKTGEIYVTGPSIMSGYVGNSDIEESALITDENGVKWFRSGDLMHMEKGELFFDGRIRRIVITKDEKGLPTKILPDKIRRILTLNEAVKDAEVITIPDEEKVNIAVAFLILKDGHNESEVTYDTIKNYCKENLPSYSVPEKFKIVERIPRNSGGKHDVKRLTEEYLAEINNQASNQSSSRILKKQ